MAASTLLDLFKEHGLAEAHVQKLRGPPWQISTVEGFAEYFEDRVSLRERCYDLAEEWQQDGRILAKLRMAYRAASEGIEREADLRKSGLDEGDLNQALSVEQNRSLTKQWKSLYRFTTIIRGWAPTLF